MEAAGRVLFCPALAMITPARAPAHPAMTTFPTTSERVDNRIGVETPEAVEFQLDLAGLGPRAGAWMIDGSAKFVILLGVGMMTALLGELAMPLVLLASFSILWLYNPLFEVFNHGKTPGKAVFDIRVAHSDGTPVGWYGAIVRNLIRVVDFLPFGYVTGIVSMIVSGRFQKLGDLAGDTLVIYERDPQADRSVEMLPDAEPVRLPVQLEPHEQEAIVAYAVRSQQLGRERSAELARILRPVVEAPTDTGAMHQLQGVARRIVQWG